MHAFELNLYSSLSNIDEKDRNMGVAGYTLTKELLVKRTEGCKNIQF